MVVIETLKGKIRGVQESGYQSLNQWILGMI